MKKIPNSFIGFLIASTFFWVILNFSETYTQVISLKVAYSDLPQNKVFNSPPPDKISVEVKATGFNLLLASFFHNEIVLSLKTLESYKKSRDFILLQNMTMDIKRQMPSGLELNRVLQDVIYFDLGMLSTKKIPVRFDLAIDYGVGFGATSIRVIPDSILVSGTLKNINKVSELKLSKLSLKEVVSSFEREVPIVINEEQKLRLSRTKVMIKVDVDKFTEGEVEVPIKVVNKTSEVMTIFPKKVKIIFRVALKDFKKINPALFKVEADYQYTKDNGLKYLMPQLKFKPDFAIDPRVVQSRIDFLINN